MGSNKTKKLLHSKENIKKKKATYQMEENMSGKKSVSKIHTEVIQLNTKKQTA